MRFHWYWPFARSEELDLAVAALRTHETMVVQTIDRELAPPAGTHQGVTVLRDLPDVPRERMSKSTWAYSRAHTYRLRNDLRRDLWKTDKFDLAHLHYVNRFTDAFSRLQRPVVISVHDVMPHVQRLGERGERLLVGRLYRRADALVVHHRHLADELVNSFTIRADKIHVVPHQVFPVGMVNTNRPSGTPRLLFFGALRANKGLPVLDEAMQLMRGEEIALTVAGRGDPAVEQLARDMARRDPRITAKIGQATLTQKRQLFEEASVVLLPYTSFASQSGVLHDAYGHGRPVVVSDVGALGSTVREDGTGAAIPPGDPDALAAAIRSVLSPETWSSAAGSGLRVAHLRSPANCGAILRNVYDTVLG